MNYPMENFVLQPQPEMETSPEPDVPGSHDEFWVFSPVSQWGSNWVYSDPEYYGKVRRIVVKARKEGIDNKYSPRMIHYAAMLIWRFYLKEKYENKPDIIDVAFESAAQLLETHSNRDQTQSHNHPRGSNSDQFQNQFELVRALDFNIRIKHPSEFLSLFITPQFGESEFKLAECIIADSFLCPCCLLHPPIRIAEGAAIMAAGMRNAPGSVIPRTSKSISFIKDMKFFYNQSTKLPP